MEFYARFRDACEKKGITVYEAVGKAGMSRSNITSWSRGGSPGIETIYKLAKAIGCEVADLFPVDSERN